VQLEWDDKKRNKALVERGLDFADVAWVDWDAAFTVEDARADYAEAGLSQWPDQQSPVRFRLVSAWRGSPRDQPSQSEQERKGQI
jgi:hypothetical protein